MRIRLVALGQDYDVEQLGTFQPKPTVADALGVGESGS